MLGDFDEDQWYEMNDEEIDKWLSSYLNDNKEEIHVDIISIKNTAQEIAEILEHCSFDNIQDSSGYYIIKEFEDGTDRAVDVHKSTDGGYPHYVIYCSFEDEDSDWVSTNDLSLESLIEKLEELSE